MSKVGPQTRKLILLLVSGLSCKEAAAQMGVTHGCAKQYVNRAQKRLGYRSRDQMMYEFGRVERGKVGQS